MTAQLLYSESADIAEAAGYAGAIITAGAEETIIDGTAEQVIAFAAELAAITGEAHALRDLLRIGKVEVINGQVIKITLDAIMDEDAITVSPAA